MNPNLKRTAVGELVLSALIASFWSHLDFRAAVLVLLFGVPWGLYFFAPVIAHISGPHAQAWRFFRTATAFLLILGPAVVIAGASVHEKLPTNVDEYIRNAISTEADKSAPRNLELTLDTPMSPTQVTYGGYISSDAEVQRGSRKPRLTLHLIETGIWLRNCLDDLSNMANLGGFAIFVLAILLSFGIVIVEMIAALRTAG